MTSSDTKDMGNVNEYYILIIFFSSNLYTQPDKKVG